MFTGLVEEVGKIKSINMGNSSGTLTIEAKKVLENTKVGDSIAVNGVCLTCTTISGNTFTADVMAETFRRSSLSILKVGSYVNLERAMAADGRFGGHIVSGHVDSTGIVKDIRDEENAVWYTIGAKSETLKYIVEKGSIAIDGISLTVAGVTDTDFKVSIIPHTKSETILIYKKVGDIVNLECDIVGKYIEKFLNYSDKKTESKLTPEFLAECGF